MEPRLAAHADAVGMDQRVFARIADLVARRGDLGLDAEQDAALERYHRDLVRAGATLGEDDRARLRAINERLSALTAAFRDNVQDETAALAVRVETAAELDGLPAPLVEAAAVDGGYVLRLALPSAQPVLEHLHDRGLRERLYRAAIARGRRGGPNDNRAVVCEMAALRAERAGLLGFGSHAEYAVAEQTAGSVAAVMEMLTAVGTAASTAARAEAERHTAALHADGHAGPLEPWDWPYYAARERRARHAVDDARLQEFFVLDRVMDDGLFALARGLYGLTFAARDDLPRPHPDARVWTVTDADGRDRGELYVDPFARDGKSGGAWLDAFAEPAPLIGRLARAVIVLNATRPADDAPVLLTPLDVRILFHEFGHALHMLLSDVAFPRVAGLNVPIDVIEFPSKLHESLAFEPAVVARYARHHETGAPLSEADVGALQASVRDGAAFTSTQGTGNALLDQAWHGLAPGASRRPGRDRRVRGGGPRAPRAGPARGGPPLPLDVLLAHLRQRHGRDALRLHVVGDARGGGARSGSTSRAGRRARRASACATACSRAARSSTRSRRCARSPGARRRSSRCSSAAGCCERARAAPRVGGRP